MGEACLARVTALFRSPVVTLPVGVVSGPRDTIGSVNESHFDEIERTLLLISGARERAARTARTIGRDGAETHLVEALEAADEELLALHRRLMQATYFAVPGSRAAENQLAL